MWVSLWLSAICGFVFGARRRLAGLLAAVSLSAFAFAAVVPLYQRFSVWIVPALYVGIALLIDRAIELGGYAFRRRQWPALPVVLLVLVAEYRLCGNIVARGKLYLDARRHATDKQQLDDRAAVAWLMNHWEPGDVLMTTHLAWPAVWWYGPIPISDATGSGGFMRDGSPMYEVEHTFDCHTPLLENTLKNRRRVLIYLGFDVEPRFDDVFLHTLGQLGGMTTHGEFSVLGRAAVIDLRVKPSDSIMQLRRKPKNEPVGLEGCINVRPAHRW
jgi:hypothetical protein